MGWYGKLIGAVLGAIIGRGLFGAIVGLLIGHQFDRRARPARTRVAGDPRALQLAFFRATFQVMGHAAKADGRVTAQESTPRARACRLAERTDVRRAIDLYTDGKSADFALDEVLGELRATAAGRDDLCRLFVQIQLEAALQGGGLNPASRAVFARMCSALGVSAIEFAALEAMLRMRGQAGPGPARTQSDRLADAYQVLGVRPDAADAEVTLAYRRQVSQSRRTRWSRMDCRNPDRGRARAHTARARGLRDHPQTPGDEVDGGPATVAGAPVGAQPCSSRGSPRRYSPPTSRDWATR
jgi:DnaJ like chaperone protein